MASTLLRDLDEGVTGHILHPIMGLMHELKQLVHHRLQELPMGSAVHGTEGREESSLKLQPFSFSTPSS